MISKLAKISIWGLLFVVVSSVSAYLTITFFVKSEKTVVVPNLIGKDIVSSLQLLSNMKLNTKVKGTEYSAHVPANHVISQSPTAGSQIKIDRDVKVIISAGTQKVLLPSLAGLTRQQARIIVEENGLAMGHVARTWNNALQEGIIFAQSPRQGTQVLRGTEVNVLLSNGRSPQRFMMVDLRRIPLNEAVLRLEALALFPGSIRTVRAANTPVNTVIGQIPEYGQPVEAGSTIDLEVNGLQKAQSPYGDEKHSDRFIRHRIDRGFLKRRIRVHWRSDGVSVDLFDDYIEPGDELWLWVPHTDEATIFLYENDDLIEARVLAQHRPSPIFSLNQRS
jgi:serine/threonine-protein kinase